MNNEPTPAPGHSFAPRRSCERYAHFDRLRSIGPIHWDCASEKWLVTGYGAAVAALRNSSLSAHPMNRPVHWLPADARDVARSIHRAYSRQILFCDPPHHSRLRRRLAAGFTPTVVREASAHIERVANDLLERVSDRTRADLVNDYAAPLAAEVIVSLLGVTIRHPGRFVEWMSNTATVLSGDKRSPRGTAVALRHVHTCLAELDSLIFGCTPEPANTFLRSLADESREPGGLSRADVTSNVAFLLFAGYETTASLIGNTIFMLLRDRRRFGGAGTHASIQPATIEELLRYESPVQIAVRVANADTQIDGQRIRAGDRLLVLLGSANRDPSRFPRPHILDPSRAHDSHLAFSHGPHYCLGAGLARSEGKIAVDVLFRCFPDVRLVSEDADWRDIPEFRGLRRLPVWLR